MTLEDWQAHFGAGLAPAAYVETGGAALGLVETEGRRRLAVTAPRGAALLGEFAGEAADFAGGQALLLCPLDHANAAALRQALPDLQPRLLGLATSAGCGDRLGLATPGHVRAFQAVARLPGARPLAAIFAQQSMREMGRTNRTPGDVLADATWGAFEAGWRGPVGADADHLKTPADIDVCAAAGFSFFTFDPGAYVDSAADTDTPAEVERKVAELPWDALESAAADLPRQYAGKSLALESGPLRLEAEAVLRAAAKYGRAIAHVAKMYRHLAGKGVPFEVEVSVDETETPTTHAEHAYFAGELRRLGVAWVSLAPRYVGRFEKGIDYLGDLRALQADLAGHAAVARALGPYKLSLHSGSDKFSVYPLLVEAAGGQAHLKTAGTSYLEALRVLAHKAAPLFRQIAALAAARYETDRASYHVSATLERWQPLDSLADAALPRLLDEDNAREILHVTFGSALAEYGDEIRAALAAQREAYAEALEVHFVKHLRPFAMRG